MPLIVSAPVASSSFQVTFDGGFGVGLGVAVGFGVGVGVGFGVGFGVGLGVIVAVGVSVNSSASITGCILSDQINTFTSALYGDLLTDTLVLPVVLSGTRFTSSNVLSYA